MENFKSVFECSEFEVFVAPFGEYGTNCFVAVDRLDNTALVVDPGIGAAKPVADFLEANGLQAKAILNTHGHFDHTWDNAALQGLLGEIDGQKVPLVCPQDDAFMLSNDCFCLGQPASQPSVLVGVSGAMSAEQLLASGCASHKVGCANELNFGRFSVRFICYPGHTPGCSVVVVALGGERVMFSGDFIFKRSIGRSDFPYSNASAMRESLARFASDFSGVEMVVFPGHGEATTLSAELQNIPFWIERV